VTEQDKRLAARGVERRVEDRRGIFMGDGGRGAW
jgi:hypothetical protein